MKSNQNQYFMLIIALFNILYTSCVDNRITIYSDNRYKPIPEVATRHYKSQQLREGQLETTALGIAISGGGSRAQYFGLGVLMALDEIKIGKSTFLNEIDYISSVSGGGYAAGYYLTLKKNGVLNDYPSFLEFWKSKGRKDSLQEFMYKDATVFSILKLGLYEKNSIRKPYPNMIDYELLQYPKVYKKGIIQRLYLKDFFVPALSNTNVTLPMFVTNGTIYNNGERIPFMPHILDSLKITGSLLPEADFDMQKGYGFPLAYAITGSAAFPGVLPMLKLKIQGDSNVIRVIDGGAVDNLGFTTLFELLNSDNVENVKKKALIIDCGGFGKDIQQQKNNKITIRKLVKRALLYTVDINLLYADKNIKLLADEYHIDNGSIEKIGFSTIKDRFITLEEANDASKNSVEALKLKIKSKSLNWEGVYKDFVHKPFFKDYTVNNISEIPTDLFSSFGILETFELFELAAQIETKVKIYPWEKQILVLAGRYAVYLKQNEIKKLLD